MSSRAGGPSTAAEDQAMLLRALLDQCPLAVAVGDANGRLKWTSPALKELLGNSSHGVSAAHLPEFFHLYNADGTERLAAEDVPMTRAAAGETVRDFVLSVRRPGESVRYLRCNAAPLKAHDGENAGAIMLVADVTAEHLVVSRQDRIRQALLDTVNHELRTPLTVLLANAELIVDAARSLPDDLQRPLSAIVRASGKLRDSVQHVTNLVDLEALAHADLSECNLSELLAAVVDRNRNQASHRNISVHVECPEPFVWRLDPTLVKRAVAALLENAISYGPGHSEVTLSARLQGEVLRLSVTDQGAGIPPEDRERLTKVFERGTPSLDAQHRPGLGLPLAHVVATSHHGALSFTSHEPRGFTATLLLP